MSGQDSPAPQGSPKPAIASAFAAHANVDAGWNTLNFDQSEELSVEQCAGRQRQRVEKVPRLKLGGTHGNNGNGRLDVLGALDDYDLPSSLPEESTSQNQPQDRRVRKSHLPRLNSTTASNVQESQKDELNMRRKTRTQRTGGVDPLAAVVAEIEPELSLTRSRRSLKSKSSKHIRSPDPGNSSVTTKVVGNKARHRQKRGGLSRAYSEELEQLGFAGPDALYWQMDNHRGKENSKVKHKKPGLKRTVSEKVLSRTMSAEPGLLTKTNSSSQKNLYKLRSGGTTSSIMEEKLEACPEPTPIVWSGKTDVDSNKERLTHTEESVDYRTSPSLLRADSATPDYRMSPSLRRADSATPDYRMSPSLRRADSATPDYRMSPMLRRADSATPDALSVARPLSRKGSRPRTPLDIPVFPKTDSLARTASVEPGMILEGDLHSNSFRNGGLSRPMRNASPAKITRAVSLKDMALMEYLENDVKNKPVSDFRPPNTLHPAASMPAHQFQNALGGLSRWSSLQRPPSSPSTSSGDNTPFARMGRNDTAKNPQPLTPPTQGSPFASAQAYYGQIFSEQSRDLENGTSLARVDTALQSLEQNSQKSVKGRMAESAFKSDLPAMEQDATHMIQMDDSEKKSSSELLDKSGIYRNMAPGDNHGKHPMKPPVPPRPSSSDRVPEDAKSEEKAPKGVGLWALILHYLSLIVAEFPLRSHRRWLRKMYEENRLSRPAHAEGGEDYFSDTETIGSLISPRPKKGHRRQYSSDEEFMRARYRRSRSFQGVQNLKRAGKQRRAVHGANDALVEVELGRMPKKSPRMGSFAFPSIGVDLDSASQVNRKPKLTQGGVSREFVGELWTNLRPRLKKASMSGMGWLSGHKEQANKENNVSEVPRQPKTGKLRLRRRRGRLARAWDQIRHPISGMRRKHKKSKHKAMLMAAISKYESNKYSGPWDRFKTQVFIWSQWAFELMSPPRYSKKFLFFTILFPFLLSLIFFFMAGEYPLWLTREGGEVIPEYEYGPTEMSDWLVDRDHWRTFKSDFLVRWGARFLPSVPGEGRRWFTSTLIHESFSHLASNVLLFIVLSWGLEGKYGFWRTSLVCLFSGVAGNFVSAAGEDPCALVLGASGCVFGLAGFYIVDLLIDFKHVVFPFLRLFGVLVFLAATAVALATQKDTSHLSHVGGFLAGCGMSFVLIPRFIDERFEAALPWMLLLTVMLMFVTLPIIVYLNVLPGLVCQQV